MTKTEFDALTTSEYLELFRRKHILITDSSTPSMSFNEEGLQTLGNLDDVIDIQGKQHSSRPRIFITAQAVSSRSNR